MVQDELYLAPTVAFTSVTIRFYLGVGVWIAAFAFDCAGGDSADGEGGGGCEESKELHLVGCSVDRLVQGSGWRDNGNKLSRGVSGI